MFKDKFECYKHYRRAIEESGGEASEYREINYGLQFTAIILGEKQTVRVYESQKKGVNPDLSQVKNSESLAFLQSLAGEKPTEKSRLRKTLQQQSLKSDLESTDLIGTDESGKGDYFGPLVIAGVYADENTKQILREIGVTDSKKLKDWEIADIAFKIKQICICDVVTIGNSKYNELYDRVRNLNKLLAWGHARVIENMLGKADCDTVLSDQFGSPELIENALMEKGQRVTLEQKPRAEENIVVAAASIIARNEFVECMDKMSHQYKIEFPKGASNKIVIAGKAFVLKYGKERLSEVAKLHFKTTDSI